MDSFCSLNLEGEQGNTDNNELRSGSEIIEDIMDPPTTEMPDHNQASNVLPSEGTISSRAPSQTLKSPRSCRSNASSGELYKYSSPRKPLLARGLQNLKSSPMSRPSPMSNIPLPLKGVSSNNPPRIPSLIRNPKSNRSSITTLGRNTTVNKHTLEIQYLNKNKRFVVMKKELLDKQRPVLDLYQSLLQIKKKLEEHGKIVHLDDLKVVPFDDKVKTDGGGENVSVELVSGMRGSIEEIPKTLMDICKNLLGRRALIVELLESVTKSEIDATEVLDKIDSLKNEGTQLQQSLDVVIAEHETKINELVKNWQTLLTSKTCTESHAKVEDIEAKLRIQEKLVQDSNQVIHDLHKRLDEKRICHDKSMAELNGVIQTLKEQIKKLEHDLEIERKSSVEIKSRNSTNSQTMKSMKAKNLELENDKKNTDAAHAELQRKYRVLQDQIRAKEQQWLKERDELNKSLKHQENLLQKLKADNNQFETRLDEVSTAKSTTEEELSARIATLEATLESNNATLASTMTERNEALEKCHEFEDYISRMRSECIENINKVSTSMQWGKAQGGISPEAETYMQEMAKDHRIRELEDQVLIMAQISKENDKLDKTAIENELDKQRHCIEKYQDLLEESETKLKEKSTEIATLRNEIRQLKVRQEALEEQSFTCPIDELKKMIESGRQKLKELMHKSMESEQKIENYMRIIEKQGKQMNELENLLRYRENMAGVLKASRDELVLEKESLTRYSQEMRTVLSEITKENKMKDRLIKEFQEKINIREKQITKLEKDVKELEANLMMTNEKRFKLQETVGTMEKELQATKAHVNQLADINTRNRLKFIKPF